MRAFEVIELARRSALSAEAAELLYNRAGGDLARAIVIGREEGLLSGPPKIPPISATGRSEDGGN